VTAREPPGAAAERVADRSIRRSSRGLSDTHTIGWGLAGELIEIFLAMCQSVIQDRSEEARSVEPVSNTRLSPVETECSFRERFRPEALHYA
jgi:hypothetical protein